MATRYACIHGHFYQPPRENPWLESVEVQDSAYPYHDWNERVTAESYAPNTASRVLDVDGRIAAIVNNYARISYNIGPTLLSWMQENAPDVYRAVLDADRESAARFGQGSAMAQAYHHLIMPLANGRDKRTQVIWGVADFRHRFGRMPVGMWLPETAVDLETLDLLAEHGIRFTVLSPYQAKRFREGPDEPWQDATGARIDPTRPYVQHLPSGRTIALFFYDAPVSQAVAFEKLLTSGERFAARIQDGYREGRAWPQLMHIATDGESYGHHHPHGDMALAFALSRLEEDPGVALTNYAAYLDAHPPTAEAEVAEGTAWSCMHGVGRWMADCGCNSGGKPGWHQKWRAPLRAAFDRLRDKLAPLYEEHASRWLADPWAARDAYVEVIMDRSRARDFLARHAKPGVVLDEASVATCLKLLEMQRHCMMMYTSCGWFFDDVSGVETTQVLTYAARAVQLAQELFGEPFQDAFIRDLEQAPSNVNDVRTAAGVYRRHVLPAQVDLAKVAAHDALGSLFGMRAGDRLPGYTVQRDTRMHRQHGRSQLAFGILHVTSRATLESQSFNYAGVHFGDHNVLVGVKAATPGPQGLAAAQAGAPGRSPGNGVAAAGGGGQPPSAGSAAGPAAAPATPQGQATPQTQAPPQAAPTPQAPPAPALAPTPSGPPSLSPPQGAVVQVTPAGQASAALQPATPVPAVPQAGPPSQATQGAGTNGTLSPMASMALDAMRTTALEAEPPAELVAAFERGDFPETVRVLDSAFQQRTYSLTSMFQDKQRQVVRRLLEGTLKEARAAYGAIYDRNAHLIRFLGTANAKVPKPLRIAAEFVLAQRLRDALTAEPPEFDRIGILVEEARQANIQLDGSTLGFALRRALDRLQASWLEAPDDTARLQAFSRLACMLEELPFQSDLWRIQNRFYAAATEMARRPHGPEWQQAFTRAAAALAVRVPG